MVWQDILWTTLFAIVGYLIGSISNAIILCKFLGKEDIRTKGSGNAGATNVLRNYGKKMGLIVFILDILKTVVAIMIAWTFQRYVKGMDGIVLAAVGFAVIVGHMYPIYFKFQGGKGAACSVGLFTMAQWPQFFIGMIIFIVIVKITRMVSVGSITSILIMVGIYIGLSFIPGQDIINPIMNNYAWWVTTIFLFLSWVLITFKHKENIKRIIQGKENKI